DRKLRFFVRRWIDDLRAAQPDDDERTKVSARLPALDHGQPLPRVTSLSKECTGQRAGHVLSSFFPCRESHFKDESCGYSLTDVRIESGFRLSQSQYREPGGTRIART